MELNQSQQRAVTTKDHNVLVVAASGSGKTRTIMERIQYLLDKGEDPSGIVAITFTNLAAHEMRSRLKYDGTDLFIGTIHSYANQQLVENGVDTTKWLIREQFDELLKLGANVDLPREVNHLLVDEFQDLCDLEYEFICNIPAENRFYVGDDWQAIYGFKGGNLHLFLGLMDNPYYTTYLLPENYRTAPEILSFAEDKLEFVSEKCDKVVKPMVNTRGRIINCDYRRAISQIEMTLDYKDWFILTRTNNEKDVIKDLLRQKQIPSISFQKRLCSPEEINEYVNRDAVKLLTIHAAKGLESEKVIVVGAQTYNDEECRVAYVAATRAKSLLYWCPKIPKSRNTFATGGMITFGESRGRR